jgi:hypothetical protein
MPHYIKTNTARCAALKRFRITSLRASRATIDITQRRAMCASLDIGATRPMSLT